jgi:hypothetical protein
LEDNLAVSYKTKYTFTIASSEQASWYFSKWVENLWPQKNLHTSIYSFTQNCQNLEATTMYFSRRMVDKLCYIQTARYSWAWERHELSRHEKKRRNCKHILLSERSWSEKAMHCMVPPTDLLEKAELWRQ